MAPTFHMWCGVIGRTYVLRGERWHVICRWARSPRATFSCPRCGRIVAESLRNVLIERESDGHRVVRPFRGLRRAA